MLLAVAKSNSPNENSYYGTKYFFAFKILVPKYSQKYNGGRTDAETCIFYILSLLA